MEMVKVLIAYPEEEFCRSMVDALGGRVRVCTCETGTQALELLDSFRPDILVLGLVLAGVDGLTILQRLSLRPVKPGILVVTRFLSDYVAASLERLKIEYVLRHPCSIEAAVGHIGEISAELKPLAVTQPDLAEVGGSLLMRLGISSKLDGFHYLQAAMPLYLADRSQSLTKELYSTIGKMYGKEGTHVERSMRHAIEAAWRKRNDALWREIFPTPPDMPVAKPSNGDFIASVSVHLSYLATG